MSQELVPTSIEQAAALLASAFLEEDDFRLTFWRARRMTARQARALFDLQVLNDRTCSAAPLGVVNGGQLEAVITCQAPRAVRTWSLSRMWREHLAEWAYFWRVPPIVRSRIDRYSRWGAANGPSVPHFFVTSLAVAPSSQGQGLVAALLAGVVELSRLDAESRGVAISTYSPAKKALYERHGFRAINHAFEGGVESWVLYLDHAAAAPLYGDAPATPGTKP